MTSPARGGPDTAGVLAAYLQQRFAPPGPFGFATRDWRIEAEQVLALPVVQRLAVEKAAEAVEAAGNALYLHREPITRASAMRFLHARADALAAAAQPTDGRTGE